MRYPGTYTAAGIPARYRARRSQGALANSNGRMPTRTPTPVVGLTPTPLLLGQSYVPISDTPPSDLRHIPQVVSHAHPCHACLPPLPPNVQRAQMSDLRATRVPSPDAENARADRT